MSWGEFGIYLGKHISVYLFPCLVVSGILYYMLYRKKVISLLEPFTMSVVGSMFGFSTVLFLKITGAMNDRYFFQYLFSQAAFWTGFFAFNYTPGKSASRYDNKPLRENTRYFFMYLVTSCVYILSNIVIYMVTGIPLFAKESRLEFGFVGGGFGMISRIISVFSPVCLYLTWYFLFCSKPKFSHKIYAKFMLMIVIIFTFFGGSKSAFLGIINQLYLFLLLNRDHCGRMLLKIKKYQIPIIGCGVILACVTIVIQSRGDIVSAVSALMFRFVAYGDAYYMAYPHSIIESLSKANVFIVFFGDFFRTIRVLSQEYIPPGMGFELSEIANKAPGIMTGPNPRHNVYGYVNFGFWGCVLFSLFLGLILNRVRSHAFNAQKNTTHEKKLTSILIYSSVLSLESDFPSAIMRFDNIVFLFPMILLFSLILRFINTKTPQEFPRDFSLHGNI